MFPILARVSREEMPIDSNKLLLVDVEEMNSLSLIENAFALSAYSN